MAIFATTAYGHFGDNNYRGVLSFWNDDTLIAHHDLGPGGDGWSVFGYNIALSLTPDGQYVCATRGEGLPEQGLSSESRVYNVQTGTYKAVPMLRNKNKHGPTINVVRWSPRGYFISGFGDYAYDPYKDAGIALPGASPAALVPDNITYGEYSGFSVLPVQGWLVEAAPLHPTIPDYQDWNFKLVVKDLFTGLPVTPPAAMVETPGNGMRPCAWMDDPTIGVLYRRIDFYDFNRSLQSRTKVLNLITGTVTILPSYSICLARTVNGNMFQGTSFGSPDAGYIVHDDGTKTGIAADGNMPAISTGSVESNIAFVHKNYFFATSPGGYLQSFGLAGQSLPGVPPAFMYDPNVWLPFIHAGIQNVQGTTQFVTPIALDGQFWTNRRYTNEQIRYE